MKIKEFSWLGFNHKAVREKFEGDLEFISEMSVPIMTSYGAVNTPCAVYKTNKPNKEKGHKDYALLFSAGDSYYITGRTSEEMEPLWKANGIHCKSCGDVLISIHRHHFHKCDCENETFLDGGNDYQRIGGVDLSQIESVVVNLLTKEIKVVDVKHQE